MKERGIPFSAPMVRALLAGQKTVTRRVVKDPGGNYSPDLEWARWRLRCPYGMPGDRLWVRETWRLAPSSSRNTAVQYRANDGMQRVPEHVTGDEVDRWLAHRGYVYVDGHGYRCTEMKREQRWNPAIHLPRWGSRITLDVVSVRVERLHDIDEADALREGIDEDDAANAAYTACAECQRRDYDECVHYDGPRAAYRELWNDINGAGAWNANPFVWRVEFARAAS